MLAGSPTSGASVAAAKTEDMALAAVGRVLGKRVAERG